MRKIVTILMTGIDNFTYAANNQATKEDDIWIYYTDYEDMLHKVKADGTEKTKFNNIQSNGIIKVEGDWVYYQSFNQYRMWTNGTDISELDDNENDYYAIVGDWKYYRNNSDDGKLYKIRTDGTQNTKLYNDSCWPKDTLTTIQAVAMINRLESDEIDKRIKAGEGNWVDLHKEGYKEKYEVYEQYPLDNETLASREGTAVITNEFLEVLIMDYE